MKPDKKEVGKRIKFIKENHNPPISLSEFGQILKNTDGKSISKGTVDSWTRGFGIPAQSVIEQIALLGNTTIDWVYWGGLRSYINAYLKENQFEEFVEEYPDTLILIEKYCRDAGFDDEKLPDINSIHKCFMSVFKNKFKQIIETVIEPYTNQIPNYLFDGFYSEGPKELQMMKYKDLVYYEVEEKLAAKEIKWNDKDIVIQIAKEKLDEWVAQFNRIKKYGDPSEIRDYKYFIENTKDEEGIKKIFLDLALNDSELSNKKLIKAFLELGKKLSKL